MVGTRRSVVNRMDHVCVSTADSHMFFLRSVLQFSAIASSISRPHVVICATFRLDQVMNKEKQHPQLTLQLSLSKGSRNSPRVLLCSRQRGKSKQRWKMALLFFGVSLKLFFKSRGHLGSSPRCCGATTCGRECRGWWPSPDST